MVDDQVASCLKNWAVNEMGFRDNESPDSVSKLDLSGISIGPLADVWIYIMEHVKAETTVAVIKGNIKLNAGGLSPDNIREELTRERNRLVAEVTELRRSAMVLQNSLTETLSSVQEKEKDAKNLESVFADCKRSNYICERALNQIQEQAKLLRSAQSELENNLQSLAPQLDESCGLDRYKIDLENMCKMLQSLLTNELFMDNSNTDKVQSLKMSVGNNLATLLDTLPHPLFVKLIEEQLESDISLWTKMEAPSASRHKSDTQENLPDTIQPLQKLLYDLYWFYADSRSRADKAKKIVQSLKSQLNLAKCEATHRLSSLPSLENGMETSILQLFQLKMDVASRKAAVDELRNILAGLQDFCSRSKTNQKNIEDQIETIQRNSHLANYYTNIICALVRKHADSRGLILQSATRLQRMVGEDLESVHNLLENSIVHSTDNHKKELECYEKLKSTQLLYVDLEGVPTPIDKLAIHRLCSQTSGATASGIHLQSAFKHLGIHQNLPVFLAFKTVGNAQLQLQKMQQAIKWHGTRQAEILEQYEVSWVLQGTRHIKRLAKILEEKRKRQEGEILPALALRRSRMDESSKLMTDIQMVLKEWCDEPAKLIKTGRMVNGSTLEEWRNGWNKSFTACRKKN